MGGLLHERARLYTPDNRTPADATVACHTQPFDVWRTPLVSAQATLSGAMGTISIAITLQRSNQIIPPGRFLGVQPANRGGWAGDGGWQPDESSWVDLGDSGTATLTDNATTIVLPSSLAFFGRWLRVKSVPAAGFTGGTLVIDVMGQPFA